jgi:hypothetical protein
MSLTVYGRRDKIPSDYIKYNVTSTSKDKYSRFSPFILGPCVVKPLGDEIKSKNMENAWQFSKKYKSQTLDEWKVWSMKGFNDIYAHRYPMGRGAIPEGKLIDYIEARYKIYSPLYAAAVEKDCKDLLAELKSLYDEGKKIALFDFDGYDYEYTKASLEDVMYNPKRKMGHAFIIAMIITNNRVWEKDYDPKKIKPFPSKVRR